MGQTVFSRLEIQPENAVQSSPGNSELRSVRVNILCRNHVDIREIEQVLYRLTTPSEESVECVVFEKQILKERWLLESSKHAIKRLEMDQERDKFAMVEEPNDTEMTASATDQESVRRSPFRLTSYGVRENGSGQEPGLLNMLLQLNQSRTDNLELMTQTLKKLQEKSKGFLSLTGAPRMEPVAKSLTFFRLLVLSILCALVWVLLMGWLQPIRGSFASLFHILRAQQKKLRSDLKGTGSEISESKFVNSIKSLDIAKTLHWMQHEGIPYLGSIQIAVWASKEKGPSSLALMHVESQKQERAGANALIMESKSVEKEHSIRLLKRMSDGSLVFWIGLLALRLLFDPLWRELAMVAPLAALSRIISGIQ